MENEQIEELSLSELASVSGALIASKPIKVPPTNKYFEPWWGYPGGLDAWRRNQPTKRTIYLNIK